MSEEPATAKILLFTGVRRDPRTGKDDIEALIQAAVLAGKLRRFPMGPRALPLGCSAIGGMAAAIARASGPAGDKRPAVLNFSCGHNPSGRRVLPVGINEEDGA
ncbi:MAG: hypothetical protein ACK5PJ_06430 [Ralstonia sp.]